MTALGEEVLSHLGNARHDVIIVAPFMRTTALDRLFAHVPDGRRPRW